MAAPVIIEDTPETLAKLRETETFAQLSILWRAQAVLIAEKMRAESTLTPRELEILQGRIDCLAAGASALSNRRGSGLGTTRHPLSQAEREIVLELIALRELRGLNQHALDDKIGWADGQTDKFERAARRPSLAMLIEWAEGLGARLTIVPAAPFRSRLMKIMNGRANGHVSA